MDESGELYPSQAAGIEIYRRVFTPGPDRIQGGALLFHGLGDHIGCHRIAAELFRGRGFLSVGIDWPGHGLSGGRRGDIAGVAIAAALIAEAQAHLRSLLPPGGPVGIYAHSAGAFFALDYLSKQGRVADPTLLDWVWLSSPLLQPEYGQSRWRKLAAALAAKLAPRLTFDTGVRSERCRHRDENRDEPRDVVDLCHHLVSARLGADLLVHARNIERKASAIGDPVRLLITQGAEDAICPPAFSREFFERVPARDKTYTLLPGLLHEPLREPDNSRVLAAVEKWFDSAPAASARQ